MTTWRKKKTQRKISCTVVFCEKERNILKQTFRLSTLFLLRRRKILLGRTALHFSKSGLWSFHRVF